MSKPRKQKSKSAKKGFMPKQAQEKVSKPQDKTQKLIIPEQINSQLDLGIKYCQGGQFPEAEACFQ